MKIGLYTGMRLRWLTDWRTSIRFPIGKDLMINKYHKTMYGCNVLLFGNGVRCGLGPTLLWSKMPHS